MAAAQQAGKRAVLGLRAGGQAVQELQRSKPLEFFREIARCVPTVVRQYKLEELTSVPELRSNVAAMFRKHSDVQMPQVVDMLIYKGREELEVRRATGRGVEDLYSARKRKGRRRSAPAAARWSNRRHQRRIAHVCCTPSAEHHAEP